RAGGFGWPPPAPRRGVVAPPPQLVLDLGPACRQHLGQVGDGDAVDARGALVAHHGTQGSLYVVWGTDLLHEVGGRRRAFGAGCRRGHFDLLPAPARGFTGAGRREGQFPLVWRSRRGHETPVLLALSFNPHAGDRSGLRPTGRPTMPSADSCAAVGPPCDGPSPVGHGAGLLG